MRKCLRKLTTMAFIFVFMSMPFTAVHLGLLLPQTASGPTLCSDTKKIDNESEILMTFSTLLAKTENREAKKKVFALRQVQLEALDNLSHVRNFLKMETMGEEKVSEIIDWLMLYKQLLHQSYHSDLRKKNEAVGVAICHAEVTYYELIAEATPLIDLWAAEKK